MGRPLRSDEPDGWHHVMNHGADRQLLYRDDQDRLHFEYRLTAMVHEHNVEIHAFCLMGNHFHLLMHCPDGGLSDAIHQMASSYARRFNERAGRDGPLFRSRFTSVTVGDERQLLTAAVYIHRNPIDLVPVGALPAYRWSSLACYLGHRPTPAWLRTGVVGSVLTPSEHLALVIDGVDLLFEAIDEAVSSVAPLDPSERRAARVLLLVDAGADPREVVTRLGLSSPAAFRMVLARARRRRRDDARFAVVVDSARSLLRARDVAHRAWHDSQHVQSTVTVATMSGCRVQNSE